MEKSNSGRFLKTLETAIQIIDVIQANEGMTIGELTDELGMAQSTVHGYVKTLERSQYLVRENGTFYLGMAFLEKGGYVRLRKPAYHTVIPVVETLAQETNERAQFIVESDGIGTYIHTATGNNAVQVDARIGKSTQLHASSAGKAILSRLPDDRVDEIVARHGLPSFTENTITDRTQLQAELEEIRERGYSVNNEESISGLRAVGTAVTAEDELIGGISVSGPAHRLKDGRLHNEILDMILGAANELQLRLEYE